MIYEVNMLVEVKKLLKQLQKYNAQIKVENGKLKIASEKPLPDALLKKLKELKPFLLEELTYHAYKYDELVKILTEQLKKLGGYVFVKTPYLDEEIVFALPEYNQQFIKQGYVVYLPSELVTLLIKKPNFSTLKTIHEAKKVFEGKILLQ